MSSTGQHTIVGVVLGSTWRTGAQLAALDGFIPLSIDPITLQGDPIEEVGIGNFDELPAMDLIAVEANPTIVANLRREGAIWKFMANLFGDDTVSGPSGNVFTHTFNWQQRSTLIHTMAMEIGDADIWEWPSLKVVAAIIEGDGEGWVGITFETIGSTINIAGDGTNVSGDFDNVTYDTKVKKIKLKSTRIRINGQSGGALGSSDEQNVSNWRLEIRRPYEREDLILAATDGTETQTDEPIQEGVSMVKLSLTYKDYDKEANDNSLFDDLKDETEYKADIDMAITIGSDAHDLLTQLPRLRSLPQESSIDGAGRVTLTRHFRALDAAASPTGMTINTLVHMINQDVVTLAYEV